MKQMSSKQRIFLATLVIFPSIIIVVLLRLQNNDRISKLVEDGQTVKITAINDASVTTEYTFSKEESEELLQILGLENLDFTDNVLKSAFETIYLVELDGKHIFHVNRFAEFPENGFYITYLKNGILKKVYLGAPLDEAVVTSIELMIAKNNTP